MQAHKQFYTDKQTLEELNLLGRYKSGSLLHLFNKTLTRGGEKLLDSMFHQPLTCEKAINERTAIFRFFGISGLSFSFDHGQVSTMQEYIESAANNTRIVHYVKTNIRRWMAAITRDDTYKRMIQGLQATILTIQQCRIFTALLRDVPECYKEKVQQVTLILNDQDISALAELDIYAAIPTKQLSRYDQLLKNSLRRKMEVILDFIYHIDVYRSVATVAREKNFCYANALPPDLNLLVIDQLSHPSVLNAVGNSLSLNESKNVFFLTGANMAGKSTLMKSVGIAVYLAHIGFPVAAATMEFSVRDGLFTSINVADNVGLGYSHFFAEVVRVKQAAEATASGKRLLLIFDELFKGTNVKDAYDGTLAVIDGFAGYQECLFIISTHIIEAGEALRQKPNIIFRYMPTIMEGGRPRYTYQLSEGITEDRQGMMIIRNEGILQLLE